MGDFSYVFPLKMDGKAGAGEMQFKTSFNFIVAAGRGSGTRLG